MAENSNMHGGYFSPPGFMRVETGGSHEENPNGGVQIGVDDQGIPNMLEEGEPVYDDYVYSDNIRAEKDILTQFHLPEKYAGKLYSEIADAYADEAEDRPLDPISNNGLRVMLGRLADAQEQQKQNQQQKELEDELANMSPEELAELEAMLSGEQEQPMNEIIPGEQVAEQAPVASVMANGGPINKFATGSQMFSVPAWLTSPVPDNLGTIRYKLRNNIQPEFKPLIPDSQRIVAPVVRVGNANPVEQTDNTVFVDNPAFPTWMRYLGGIGHGLLALNNAVTPETRFRTRPVRPYYPTGQISLQDLEYNPIDMNLALNAGLSQGAGTISAIRGSGLGPSTGAAIVVADRNIGQNIGNTLLQGWQSNNQHRNEVIAANNNNAAQRANFNYTQALARAQALDTAQRANIQNDLMVQRLNDVAESQKYGAISNEIGFGLDALTKMGDENLAFNMVNSVYPYGYRDKSGRVVYRRPAAMGGLLLKKYKG